MADRSKLISLVLFMTSGIIGLLIFTRGFLLTRIAITNTTLDSNSTTFPSQYKKAVVIVIDALRFDFVEAHPSSDNFYHNKLPFVHKLLLEHKDQTRLYKFIADPPTTTMQRLKGLTTGGLPTFVDAGSNFASAEINEDNIIQQMVNAGKKMVFMGDDTWESLFAGRFTRSYPFPSFNVHDLHTVDQGVKKHLLPEMRGGDYTLLIAHFLGVDHCGHRYGPDHPAMADKLSEMNEVLRSVVETMDEDTLLVVLGDHGMTRTGDHGGDSESEINAALLLHTKRPVVWSAQQGLEEVAQIDLVPTLSLLLGLPVPYSNLGTLIPGVIQISQDADSERQLLRALHINQLQISNYLQHYNQLSNDLPKPQMSVLHEMEQSLISLSTKANPDLQKLKSKYLLYMKRAKEMCRDIWAKFDDTLMLIGFLQVLFSIIMQAGSVCGLIADAASYCAMSCQCLLTVMSLVLCYLDITPTYTLAILTALFLLIMTCCRVYHGETRSCLSSVDVFSVLCLTFYSLSSLSNSLIVNEHEVLHFLVQSVLILIYVASLVKTISYEGLKTREMTTPTYIRRIFKYPSTYLVVVLSLLLQFSQTFRACREELEDCEVSLFFTPLASLRQELSSYRNLRFWAMSVPSVLVPVYILKRMLKVRGNLNGYSPISLFSGYGLLSMAMLCIFDWLSSATPFLLDWQKVIFARSVYVLLLSAFIIIFIKPLAVYFSSAETSPISYNGSIPSLYKYMKRSLYDREDKAGRPLVYGLSTVYSAAYLSLLTATSLYLMMIAGDGMSFPLLLMLLAVVLYLDIHRLVNHQQATVSISFTVCWFLMGKYFFYSTGHQPTITNIRWDAAFHGFAQDHDNHVVPAILLFTSTFSSQVIFTLSLPLLLIVTDSCQTCYQSLHLPKGQLLTGIGEVVIAQQEKITYHKLQRLFSIYLLANLIKSFGALCSAAILRRHLMVWKIFAPAFIYEAASFILTSLVSLIAYLLFVRITRAVKHYIKDFDLEHVD